MALCRTMKATSYQKSCEVCGTTSPYQACKYPEKSEDYNANDTKREVHRDSFYKDNPMHNYDQV